MNWLQNLSRRWSPRDAADFHIAMTALNLERAKIAGVAGMMMVVWATVLSIYIPELRFSHLQAWLVTVLGIYGSLLLVRRWMKRQSTGERLRRLYVLTFALALIVICDGFSFVLSPALTSVSSFARGMLLVALVFVLRPPIYVAIAVGNELVLCGWLGWRGMAAPTLTALLDGTVGVVIGTITSLVVYAGKRAEFAQRGVILRQHAEMNELMAITAHDLRSPLLGMKNMLTLALHRGLDGERLRSVVEEAARGCERMLQLATNLVSAHAAMDAATVMSESGDLSGALAAALERARSLAEPKAQRFALRTPGAPARATYDATSLGQVLDNLIGNAVKFSPPGATIEASLLPCDAAWRIEIADEGPGIPDCERMRLFEKFARGSAVPTGGEAGSGLGLFIAHTLIQRMGGRIHHAPRSPAGSIFAIELPSAN